MSALGFSHSLQQRQAQQLVLAPQLRQSLKILQVAALDLRSVIQEELQSNPTLEELPMDGVSLEKEKQDNDDSGSHDDSHDSSRDETHPDIDAPSENREELDFSKEFQILGKLDEDWRDHMASAGGAQPYTSEDAERRQHMREEAERADGSRTAAAGLPRGES